MEEIIIKTTNKDNSYPIIIKHHLLEEVNKYIPNDKKTLIITDSNIPLSYVNILKDKLNTTDVYTLVPGENSKSFDNFKAILSHLAINEYTRKDQIVALGGGVVGDLSGYVASSYMRGIDYYNIPTTLLSQVDSSIGGKCAINLFFDDRVIKNNIGAFYFPKKVLIDPQTLKSLDKRIVNEGLFEAIKMSMTFDERLFSTIEQAKSLDDIIDDVIVSSLKIKQMVVEKDPFENGLRKTLNFGHTIGHGIESSKSPLLYHGEAVGYGMLYATDEKIRPRLANILHKYGLENLEIDKNQVLDIIKYDKKRNNDKITMIFCEQIGSYKVKELSFEEIDNLLKEDLCATF